MTTLTPLHTGHTCARSEKEAPMGRFINQAPPHPCRRTQQSAPSAFAGSPVFAAPEDGDGTAAGPAVVQGTAVHDVAAGEAYTKFIVEFKETTALRTPK